MSIYCNTPYTYRIKWSKTNMNYYGVRYAKNCHPSDLFVTYFTSSEYVAAYIKEHGLPDIIEVRKIFMGVDSVNDAISWESKVLLRINAPIRNDYLNKFGHCGKWSPEIIEKHKINTTLAMNDPDMKKQCQKNAKSCWDNPEYRKKQRAAKEKLEYVNSISKNISKGLQASGNIVKGKQHYRYDSTIYTFKHDTGIIERTTQSEIIKKYGLHQGHTSSLVNGKLKKHKGWSL